MIYILSLILFCISAETVGNNAPTASSQAAPNADPQAVPVSTSTAESAKKQPVVPGANVPKTGEKPLQETNSSLTTEPLIEDAAPPVIAPIEVEVKNVSVFDEEEGMLVKRLTEAFNYDRQGRRDPFRLPEAGAVEIPLGGYFGPFLEKQEKTLDSFSLKAIILDPAKPKAVVSYSCSDNKTCVDRIYVGDYIGENFGQVQAIRNGEVIIVQTFVEGDQKSTTTKTLSIGKSK